MLLQLLGNAGELVALVDPFGLPFCVCGHMDSCSIATRHSESLLVI
jgi:hypothetical protein